MAKPLSARSRISRNNKNRGRQFERDVADALGWQRVPYSGAIKEWGSADVVDAFYKGGGYWAAECKTHKLHEGKPAHIDIKHKWIEQMMGGETGGRHGILIVKRVRDSKKHVGKKAPIYVVFPEDTFDWFAHEVRGNSDTWKPLTNTYLTDLTKARGYNFRMTESALSDLEAIDIVEYLVGPDRNRWYAMKFEEFVRLIKIYQIMVPDEQDEQHA